MHHIPAVIAVFSGLEHCYQQAPEHSGYQVHSWEDNRSGTQDNEDLFQVSTPRQTLQDCLHYPVPVWSYHCSTAVSIAV